MKKDYADGDIKITVDEGPKFKRFMPRARGQAYEIQKKTSHVIITLDEIKKGKPPFKKVKEKSEKIVETKKTEEQIIEKEEAVKKAKEKEVKQKPAKSFFERPRPKSSLEDAKPKPGKGIMKIFRRKSF